MINIIRINETERGKKYQLRINKGDIEIMITWHAIDRSERWGLDMERVISALIYPEEVVIGHRGSAERYYKGGGMYADKIFA